MADYRRKLTVDEHRNIISKYKPHRDAQGGIFVPRTRRRLLGVKDESSGIHREDTADFWSDVRANVKNALTDLQLICEVANHDQLKEMFQLIPFGEKQNNQWKASFADVLTELFKHTRQMKRTDEGWFPIIPKDISWKAELATEIVEKCLQFYNDNGMITSKAHERLKEEVIDMLGSELGHLISRELKLPYSVKVR